MSEFTNIFSHFEEATFPIILLKTDLTVEYMNKQANSKFGKYLSNKLWHTEYLNDTIIHDVTQNVLAGKTVILTPPDIKEFSLLLFQPIFGEDRMTEYIRLSIEVLDDKNKQYKKVSPNTNLFNNMYTEIHNHLQLIEMSVDSIKKQAECSNDENFMKILNDGCDFFKTVVTTYDYIYSLMRNYNIDKAEIFKPEEIIENLKNEYYYLTAVNLINSKNTLICNTDFIAETLKAIVEHIKAVVGICDVNLKAYEEMDHFIFVFTANKSIDPKPSDNYIQQYYLDLGHFKNKAKESGGNLITIADEDNIKILYSIRKHVRADLSQEFNQKKAAKERQKKYHEDKEEAAEGD